MQRPRVFRANVTAAARLICDDGTAIPCAVENISLTGARIEVSKYAALPEEGHLSSEDLGLRSQAALVVWRIGSRVGIRFLQPISIGLF